MDQAFSQSFAKAQQLSGVSLSSFIASISVSLGIFIVELFLFLIIRQRFPDIYSTQNSYSKNDRPNWKEYLRTRSQPFDGSNVHYDRYFFCRYVRTISLIFLPASVLITPILLPLNYIHGKTAALGVSGLDTLGWSNVGLSHADRYWAHLFLGWLFITYICWTIWNELAYYVSVRQKSRYSTLNTVLVDSIPEEWMVKQQLASIFQIFPGRVTNVYFNRDFSSLLQLVAKCEQLTRSLETAETHYIRKVSSADVQGQAVRPHCGRSFTRRPLSSWTIEGVLAWLRLETVDTILFYRRELREAIEKVRIEQQRPERYTKLPSAFITFENPLAAHMVCQTVIYTRSGYMTPRTLPISAEDVVWSNVCIPWWSRSIRVVVCNVFILAMAALCVIPVAFAGLLSQIIYITRAVVWLSWINELPEWSLGVLQGVVPPVLLAVLVKGFSTALEYLIRKQGISSRSSISLKIQDFYFSFLFFQVTLIISLSAGLTAITNEVANGGSLPAALAKNLPKASNYFLSYILLQALSVSGNSLLRIDRLIGKFIFAPIFDKTVTQMLLRNKGQDLQWGTFVPLYTNLSCIGFIYAIISPIIIPFQALIFMLFWITHSKSTMLLTEQDNGGLFYPKAIKHLITGLYFMEISLLALFLLIRDAQGEAVCIAQACLMAFATVLTAVYHHLLRRAFDPLLLFSPVAGQHRLPRESSASSFHHKALRSSFIIRLPIDARGTGAAEASQIREELRGLDVVEDEATITPTGNLRLRSIGPV